MLPPGSLGACMRAAGTVGIEQARQVHGLKRVAVVDFDVHHDNGTEAIFRSDPDVMVASIHPSHIFPRSRDSSEVGTGSIVKVPLARDTPAEDFRKAFEQKILPRLMEFAPELLFVSAGFDVHLRDPLGDQRLMTADLVWLTDLLVAVADSHCDGRLVSAREGGYDPDAVAQAGAAHIGALMGH